MSNLISQLNAVYQYAVNNSYSSLYRDLYGEDRPKSIDSLEIWESLPLISKEYIGSYPFRDRLFLPYQNIDILRVSSGTTGSAPIVWPRTRPNDYDTHFSRLHPSTCFLTFYPPQHMHERTRDMAQIESMNILAADLGDLETSIALAIRAGLDHIMCPSSLLEIMIPILLRHNWTKQIRRIEFSGERLSGEQQQRFSEVFSNALLCTGYGAIETQGMAGTGIIKSLGEVLCVPTSFTQWELVDENEIILPSANETGEVVLTHLWTNENPFPLLRYKTGDRARRNTVLATEQYEILGRIELDRIKLPGGELLTPQIERAVQNIHPSLTGDFELHFKRKETASGPLPHVEIRIATHTIPQILPPTLSDELAPLIAKRLLIGPHFTYADGVERGIYSPLTCTIVPPFPKNGKKRIRLIRYD